MSLQKNLSKHWPLLFPIALSYLRLDALGAFSGQQLYPIGGSDALASVAVIRYFGEQGFFAGSSGIPVFSFPEGLPMARLPEFFSEPLTVFWQILLYLLTHSATKALWLSWLTGSLFNIWGVYLILMSRVQRSQLRLPALIGWGILVLSPWIWGRSTYHYLFSWIPIALLAFYQWWDVAVIDKKSSLRSVFIVHALLAFQSVYFAIFLAVLALLFVLGCIVSSRHRAQRLWPMALVAGLAMGFSFSISAGRMGGISAVSSSVNVATRSLQDLHTYSIRMREMLKGGPSSLWNSLYGNKIPSHDEEGSSAPLPKLVLILVVLCGIVSRQKKVGAWGFFVALGMCVLALQEIPWVRIYILHPVFPFIRAYGRLHFFMLILMSVLAVEVFKSIPVWFVRSWMRECLVSGLLLALILVDYGWPQGVSLAGSSEPCQTKMQILRKQKAEASETVMMIQTDTEFYKWHCGGMREMAFYGLSGISQIGEPWIYPDGPLVGEKCEQWGSKFARALKLSRHALWWFDGDPNGFEKSRLCLDRHMTNSHLTVRAARIFSEQQSNGNLTELSSYVY